MATEKLSPMMQQYMEIKEENKDTILMYRLGDFYEMFFDDALLASRELELTLTGRNCGLEERAPMCGVPHHSVDAYIARLVANGHKVAICEQLEDPVTAKGIVKRDIVRVFTPGTIDLADSTRDGENIFIASVCINDGGKGKATDSFLTALTIADISTGELITTEFEDNETMDILINELAVYGPKELVVSEAVADRLTDCLRNQQMNPYIAGVDASYFKLEPCRKTVMKQFDVTSEMSLGLDGHNEMISAIGALIMYLIDTQKQEPSQFKKLVIKKNGNAMQLDRFTMRNLELLETIHDHEVHGSLFGVLNKTRTAMGQRLLKSFLKEPLKNADEINLRLDAVEALKNEPLIANNIVNSLKHVYDFQRLTARVATGRANGRDLIALKTTLGQLPDIIDNLAGLLDSDNQNHAEETTDCNSSDSRNHSLLEEIRNGISDFGRLYDMIDQALVEEPPITITDGGLIKSGFSEELDELKASIADAKLWIANLEVTEKERTGIKTLKVGYNKVFGYYIDVSKGMIDKVPEDYVRKQTLVNNERYITPELKEKENMVFSAEARINKMEYEEFRQLRDSIEPYVDALQLASSNVALLDVLISFARVATENNYVKPIVDESDVIDIKAGRHPAVEQLIGSGMFVANDTQLDQESKSLVLITGPNMSGKSTYMRQTAIIVLMAQIGCYVPAESAHIGAVDCVFTRIGASDNLSYGQSTFYIEMSELSNILRNATSRSLVILDEIGRGTSTFDGLSIAWATVEYLAQPEHRTRTMFATHYHELTELGEKFDNVHNLSVAVAEDGANVVFLHNIIDGPASKSYGIHVAKIAGVPEEIRRNARIKLKELEASESSIKSQILSDKGSTSQLEADRNSSQLSFFGDAFETIANQAEDSKSQAYRELAEKISGLDINVMTPLKAMIALQEIIEEAKDI